MLNSINCLYEQSSAHISLWVKDTNAVFSRERFTAVSGNHGLVTQLQLSGQLFTRNLITMVRTEFTWEIEYFRVKAQQMYRLLLQFRL